MVAARIRNSNDDFATIIPAGPAQVVQKWDHARACSVPSSLAYRTSGFWRLVMTPSFGKI